MECLATCGPVAPGARGSLWKTVRSSPPDGSLQRIRLESTLGPVLAIGSHVPVLRSVEDAVQQALRSPVVGALVVEVVMASIGGSHGPVGLRPGRANES